jgi:ribosome biogenesis GTPase
LGPSGVGKSSLINALVGQARQATREVRAVDEKGRHTTSCRELIEVGEGYLIDTPGMREVGMWEASAGIDGAFGEVEELAARCRFRDCAHAGEPGCAVTAALDDGELAPDRLASYLHLRREDADGGAGRSAGGARPDRRSLAARTEKARCKRVERQLRARARHEPKLRDP